MSLILLFAKAFRLCSKDSRGAGKVLPPFSVLEGFTRKREAWNALCSMPRHPNGETFQTYAAFLERRLRHRRWHGSGSSPRRTANPCPASGRPWQKAGEIALPGFSWRSLWQTERHPKGLLGCRGRDAVFSLRHPAKAITMPSKVAAARSRSSWRMPSRR